MTLLNEISNLFSVLFKGAIQNNNKNNIDNETSIFSNLVSEEQDQSEKNISDDYINSYNNISEQLFINKEIKRNEENLEKWKNDFNSTLSNANISNDLKYEIASLYDSLINSRDKSQKDRINAKIQQLFTEEGSKQTNNNDLESLYYNLTLSANRVLEGAELKELYEQLSECVSSNQKYAIQNQIQQTQSAYNAEESKNFIHSYIYQQDLPENVKDELSGLYSDLFDTEDIKDKDAIEAKIKLLCEENQIDEDNEFILSLDYNVMQYEKNQKLSELFEQLSAVSSQNTRDSIISEIETIRAEYGSEIESISQKMLVNDLNTSKETKEEINELILEMSEVESSAQIDSISAKILEIMQEAGVDTQNITYINFNNSIKNLQMNNELKKLYKELGNATSKEQKSTLNKEIKDVLEKYQAEIL